MILKCPLCTGSIDTSTPEIFEAINHRLKDGGIMFRLSEVERPAMARLKRSHFLDELTGQVHLTQHDAVSRINPERAPRMLEAERTPATARCGE